MGKYLFLLLSLLPTLNLKAHFNSVAADIYGIKEDFLFLEESVQIFLDIAHICPNELFIQQKYASKGLYKEFTLVGISIAILEINKIGGTCKRNI